MIKKFDSLQTVNFQRRMKPAAIRIYSRIFPGCELEDLREDGFKVHVLDKEFGIDSLIKFDSGQWVSIQEKYRNNSALRYKDFTQEYKNGAGTKWESDGEWFKLGAQLYFYGWANRECTDFEKWVIIDIAKYKLLVEKAGGLEKIGALRKNSRHGSASFYAIPIERLRECYITESNNERSLNHLFDEKRKEQEIRKQLILDKKNKVSKNKQLSLF